MRDVAINDGAELPVITGVLVAHNDGERVWEPLRDYLRNPDAGSYILRENRGGKQAA
jgi:hypothetical protein